VPRKVEEAPLGVVCKYLANLACGGIIKAPRTPQHCENFCEVTFDMQSNA